MKPPTHSAGELIDVKNLVYWVCRKCKHHVPWYLVPESFTLTASCCGKVWDALPRFDFSKFFIVEGMANLKNVTLLSSVDRAPSLKPKIP